MKLTASTYPRFLTKDLDFSIQSILFYGPQEGLLSFKEAHLEQHLQSAQPGGTPNKIKKVRVEDLPTPWEEAFKKSQLSLFQEQTSQTLFVMTSAKDKTLAWIEKIREFLQDPSHILVLLGAGLPTSSKLVKFYEKTPGFYALGVYEHNYSEQKHFLATLAQNKGMSMDSRTLEHLTTLLPPDPWVMETELEKLFLYGGGPTKNPVTFQDIQDVIHTEITEAIDTFIHWVCVGDHGHTVEAYARLKRNGEEDITLLRLLTHHFLKLFKVVSAVKTGHSLETAIDKLTPKLFFKARDRFLSHVKRWTPENLVKALEVLKELEVSAKTLHTVSSTLCSRGFLRICQLTCKFSPSYNERPHERSGHIPSHL